MKCEDPEAVPMWRSRFLRLLPAVVTLGLLCAIADRVLASEPPPNKPTELSPNPTARNVVESFHLVLMDCMERSDELGFDGRYQLIAKSLDVTFDILGIAHASNLRGWKRLSTQDRTRWVALTRQYWASNYAHEYRSHSGQSFQTLGVEPASDEEVVVHTKLTRHHGDDVKLDYRLRKSDGVWQIMDFHIAEGSSEVWRMRQFNYAVLERRGFEGLVTEINQKIERFQQE